MSGNKRNWSVKGEYPGESWIIEKDEWGDIYYIAEGFANMSDARLMAAAPELLGCLKEVLETSPSPCGVDFAFALEKAEHLIDRLERSNESN